MVAFSPLILDGTVLKESANRVILGVMFNAKITFEKHLHSVSIAAAQRLVIMRKSWQVFHNQSLLLRSFWSIVLVVFENCLEVWCSAANSKPTLLDRVVRGAGFLAVGVLECNLAHRRSVAVLRMLCKIMSNPMHPLSGALPLLYVPVGVTCGPLVAHRHSFVSPRCWSSQYRRTFVPLSVSLWNDFGGPVFDGVGLVSFKSTAYTFLLAWSALSLFVSYYFYIFYFNGLVVWGRGLRIDIMFPLSLDLALLTQF